MRILRELSPELHKRVVAAGYPVENFVFKSSRGWKLSSTKTGDGRVEEGEEVCVAIGRQVLWKCLFDEVGEGIVEFKKIVSVRQGNREGGKPSVQFENGEVEEADLVIGADGVRSVTKKALFDECDTNWGPKYE